MKMFDYQYYVSIVNKSRMVYGSTPPESRMVVLE